MFILFQSDIRLIHRSRKKVYLFSRKTKLVLKKAKYNTKLIKNLYGLLFGLETYMGFKKYIFFAYIFCFDFYML